MMASVAITEAELMPLAADWKTFMMRDVWMDGAQVMACSC